MFQKNRNKQLPTFANINLLGKCNADCYFCLGKDIEDILSQHNQLNVHFLRWNCFLPFVRLCRRNSIRKVYITGQNTDSLLYPYLSELIDWLHEEGFTVGIRTNGLLAYKHLDIINKCTNSVGYTINSLVPSCNYKIMKVNHVPDWKHVLNNTNKPRVSIVVNRFNYKEFFEILDFLSQFHNLRYVQARRISTDTRKNELKRDIILYEQLFSKIVKTHPSLEPFYDAERFLIKGLEVCFWRTVRTSIGSMNYFTDGTISDEYFIIEGYLKNYQHGLTYTGNQYECFR